MFVGQRNIPIEGSPRTQTSFYARWDVFFGESSWYSPSPQFGPHFRYLHVSWKVRQRVRYADRKLLHYLHPSQMSPWKCNFTMRIQQINGGRSSKITECEGLKCKEKYVLFLIDVEEFVP